MSGRKTRAHESVESSSGVDSSALVKSSELVKSMGRIIKNKGARECGVKFGCGVE